MRTNVRRRYRQIFLVTLSKMSRPVSNETRESAASNYYEKRMENPEITSMRSRQETARGMGYRNHEILFAFKRSGLISAARCRPYLVKPNERPILLGLPSHYLANPIGSGSL